MARFDLRAFHDAVLLPGSLPLETLDTARALPPQRARVLKPGRNIFVCAGDVYALDDRGETLVATMLATMMVVRARPALVD